ncbi:MAG: class II D-tagatose-bisphosphate aldolase, non-catalytic subunit [Cardiobacteriaceae bacterium]|nr:class II D-tagatose-bisphosphate aldolase, non-catalytic subunit [Cardiobacteriaceae bacterium]
MKTNSIAAKIAEHKKGNRGGIVSVCSAHPAVIAVAADLARRTGEILLIESTSNQVDQFGGYTGLTPQQFITQTREFLAEHCPDAPTAVFGGDHLGPNRWQHLPPEEAMQNSEELVRQYVAAGYDKIHLDCSMSCTGDPVPLPDEIVAERAARLCRIAEDTRKNMKDAVPLVYIIGTEVPVPGGAKETLHEVSPTSPDAARTTYAIHRNTFAAHGLGDDVWQRVIALVVQPGVEFDHNSVIDYQPEQATKLSAVANEFPYAIFEAHSTDYQTAKAFKSLVCDHFAILKVGPALTFAYREAIYALNHIAHELGLSAPDVQEKAEQLMLAAPEQWQKYYHGDAQTQKLLRHYSLSDRIRYYWSQPQLDEAVQGLLAAFGDSPLPFGLAHQYLPQAVEICHDNKAALTTKNLIFFNIYAALEPYFTAVSSK